MGQTCAKPRSGSVSEPKAASPKRSSNPLKSRASELASHLSTNTLVPLALVHDLATMATDKNIRQFCETYGLAALVGSLRAERENEIESFALIVAAIRRLLAGSVSEEDARHLLELHISKRILDEMTKKIPYTFESLSDALYLINYFLAVDPELWTAGVIPYEQVVELLLPEECRDTALVISCSLAAGQAIFQSSVSSVYGPSNYRSLDPHHQQGLLKANVVHQLTFVADNDESVKKEQRKSQCLLALYHLCAFDPSIHHVIAKYQPQSPASRAFLVGFNDQSSYTDMTPSASRCSSPTPFLAGEMSAVNVEDVAIGGFERNQSLAVMGSEDSPVGRPRARSQIELQVNEGTVLVGGDLDVKLVISPNAEGADLSLTVQPQFADLYTVPITRHVAEPQIEISTGEITSSPVIVEPLTEEQKQESQQQEISNESAAPIVAPVEMTSTQPVSELSLPELASVNLVAESPVVVERLILPPSAAEIDTTTVSTIDDVVVPVISEETESTVAPLSVVESTTLSVSTEPPVEQETAAMNSEVESVVDPLVDVAITSAESTPATTELSDVVAVNELSPDAADVVVPAEVVNVSLQSKEEGVLLSLDVSAVDQKSLTPRSDVASPSEITTASS